MSSNGGRNSENDSAIPTCFGKSRDCVVHSFVLTMSTLIFVASMILSVYLTHKASMDRIVVVLIVASSLLYVLAFTSNMYHIYYSIPDGVASRSDGSTNDAYRATGISAQNSSSSGRAPDFLNFSGVRQPVRNTPPPPYEIQMSEISRMLLPGTSRITHASTRESEITEEARKLIRTIYEEIKRVDLHVAQSPRNEESAEEMVQTPENPSRQQERMLPKVAYPNLVIPIQERAFESLPAQGFTTLDQTSQQKSPQTPKTPRQQKRMSTKGSHPNLVAQLQGKAMEGVPIRGFASSYQTIQQKLPQTPKTPRQQKRMSTKGSHPNLVVQLQETALEGVPARGFTTSDFCTNEATHQNSPQTPQTPRRQQGMTSPKGSHQNLAVKLQETAVKNVPVRRFNSSDFCTNRATQQLGATNSLPTQLDLQRLIIGSESCVAAPQQSIPFSEDFLQVASKRKVTGLSNELQTRPKSRVKGSRVAVHDKDTQNNAYEPIEIARSTQSTDTSQMAYDSVDYYCIENECEDSSEQASSACSAASEPCIVDRQRILRNPSVKVRRQLSAATSRKFRLLGQSPETVLDAIATCFGLTPDEWMVAWNLGIKGVSPIERARVLGVRLHESSSSDNLSADI